MLVIVIVAVVTVPVLAAEMRSLNEAWSFLPLIFPSAVLVSITRHCYLLSVGVFTFVTGKNGNCPMVVQKQSCLQKCTNDDSCAGIKKCCTFGCRKLCVVPDTNQKSGEKLSPDPMVCLFLSQIHTSSCHWFYFTLATIIKRLL